MNNNKQFEEEISNILKHGGYYSYKLARIKVYEENTKLFNNWDTSLLGDKTSKLKGTKVYKEKFITHSTNNYNTILDCKNEDCVDTAYNLIKDGYNPAILNLASNIHPCGGYDKGSSAQEESLCYSSTLSISLYQYGDIKSKGARESNVIIKNSNVYPLDINYGGIYSPDVVFFRNNISKKYALKDKPFSCGVITVASLSNRSKNEWTDGESNYFNKNGYLNNIGREIEKNKIRTIYRIGLDNRHDSLVLGAFGCGVYHLIPEEVSSLFYEVLNEDEFRGKYKKIVFAILEYKNEYNPLVGENGKFKPFYDRFKTT